MSRVFPSTVASVAEPPTLVLLLPEEHAGWCEQFAQEGYRVIHVIYPPTSQELFDEALEVAKRDVPFTDWALITYGLLAEGSDSLSNFVIENMYSLKCCVHFSPLCEEGCDILFQEEDNGRYVPTIVHLAALQEKLHASLSILCTAEGLGYTPPTSSHHPIAVHTYPLVAASPPFPLTTDPPVLLRTHEKSSQDPYVQSAIGLSYTRTLELLRRELGPHFDLERLWEQHTYYEFVERDAPKTMRTMVATPYVNHIPTMTGGVGYDDLARFYKYHFTRTEVTPPDTEMITISRTVGADRVIDEMIFRCTHTTEIDWLAPGIKPTGKRLEIALVGIVAFRGDKLTFEHIYWDQASVLVQLGLLDATKFPVAGAEVAHKAMNPFGLPSNMLMPRWKTSEGLSVD